MEGRIRFLILVIITAFNAIALLADNSSVKLKDKTKELNIIVGNDVISCSKQKYNGTVYLSNIAGSSLTKTKEFYSCFFNEDLTCGNKIIGTACNFNKSTNCKQIQSFHPHGAVHCAVAGEEIFLDYFTAINGRTVVDNISEIWNPTNIMELRRDDGKVVIDSVENIQTASETLFETEVLPLECLFLDYFLKPPVTWSVVYSNGSEELIGTDYDAGGISTEKKVHNTTVFGVSRIKELPVRSSRKNFRGIVGVTSVMCSAMYWNDSSKFAFALQPVNIRSLVETRRPTFSLNESTTSAELGEAVDLNCTVEDADPEPVYYWHFPATMLNISSRKDSLNKSILYDGHSSILKIYSMSPDLSGEFVCHAFNLGGEARKSFNILLITDTTKWIYLGTALGIIAILAVILAAISRMYYLQRGRLTTAEIRLFEKGDSTEVKSENWAHENAQFMPYNKNYEIKWKDFNIGGDKLGEGAFGIVYKGNISRRAVNEIAVKTAKAGVEKPVILALLSELKVMIYLEKHDNIVELVGACTEFLRSGRIYILVEYCPLGSLEKYLRNNEKHFRFENKPNSRRIADEEPCSSRNLYTDITKNPSFYTDDLVSWSIQISRGMQHLESKKVIHGDLAARNILLMNKNHVKITDFGLSRQLLNYETYVRNSGDKLPWRWLAPETLKTFIFTHKSDVWSYGITLWEIFSLGQIPYPGVQWTPAFLDYLENNRRLFQPKYAADSIYKIMESCWETEPSRRSDFKQIELYLAKSSCSKEEEVEYLHYAEL